MRKVLSLVLSLALVFGSFSFAFAGTSTTKVTSDVAGTQYESAVQVLMSLGVVTGYSDGTYKPAGAVTRAEMAALIVRALGLDTTSSFVAKSNYSDMAGNWADKYVALVSGKNIVKGYPDGTFKPNAQVSYPEAITMIVRALGYTDGCTSLTGTWPANYMTLANDLEITDDVKVATTSAADRGAVAIMLYNALTVPTVTVDKEDLSAVKVKTGTSDDEFVTFLTKLNAYESEDPELVTPTMVDDEDTLCDLSAYVYATATLYYNDDDQIIAVKEISDDCDSVTGEYDSTDETVTDSKDKDYDLNDLATDTAVFFNGEEVDYQDVVSGAAYDLLDGYTVTVYGQEDSRDDFATISGIVATAPTDEYLVSSDDVDDIADIIQDGSGTIFNTELPTVNDDGDELDTADIVVKGAATSLSDIKENDVVTVYASADLTSPDKVTFVVERTTKEIKVKKVDATNDKVYDTAGTAYKVASAELNAGVIIDDDAVNATTADFEIGTTYTAYIDQFGYILGTEEIDSTPDLYGIVMTAASGDEEFTGSGTYEQAKIKMLTSDGDTSTFDVVDEGITGFVNDDNQWTATPAAYTLVKYSVDKNGDVDELDVMETANTVTNGALAVAKTYHKSSNTIGGKELASDVVVFDLQDVSTTSSATIKDGDIMKLEDDSDYTYAYHYDDDDENIKVLMVWDTTAEDDIYFAINSVTDAEDNNGDNAFELEGFIDGSATDVYTDGHAGYIFNQSTYTCPGIYLVEYTGNAIGDATTIESVTGYDTGIVQSAGTTTFKVDDETYTLADDAQVYVEVYADGDNVADGDTPDSIKVGKASDINRNDVVKFIYDSTDDDVKVVLVTNQADLD